MQEFIDKNIRYLIFGAIALAAILLLAVFGPSACKRQAAEQAKQTSRSGEAIANATGYAVGKLENRVATDQAIDAAVSNTMKEISNAPDPDTLRNAVIASVCSDPSHRNDPAC